jgi:head-tail adaptor
MQAGRLDRRIDIERKTVAQDDFGEEAETWTKIAERRAASAVPVGGDEKFSASQFMGQRVLEFRIRWASALADLNPMDRIIFPASDDPADREIFDVKDVREIGRREGLQIFAVARSEVPAEATSDGEFFGAYFADYLGDYVGELDL